MEPTPELAILIASIPPAFGSGWECVEKKGKMVILRNSAGQEMQAFIFDKDQNKKLDAIFEGKEPVGYTIKDDNIDV